MPIPCGSVPSTAACTRTGDRNAIEIVRLTWRTEQCSRDAMASASLTLPEMISSSQQRPRAIALTRVVRVADRIGGVVERKSACTSGTISRGSLDGRLLRQVEG